MDETEIQAQVARNIPQSDTSPSEPRTLTPEPADPDALHNALPLDDMLTRYELMDYFNLGKGMRNSPEVRQKMDTVMAWAKENAEGMDLPSLLHVISHQEVLMGSRLAQDRFDRLYRFVRLNNQRKQIEQQQKALYG